MIDPKKKRNVLFLASWYPNRIFPQNGNFIRRHAQAVALQCNVACLHVVSVEGQKEVEVDAKWVNGLYEVIVYFGKSPGWLPLRKYRRYNEAQRIGYQNIQEEFGQIDLVHLNVFFPAGIFALELKEKSGLPFIITEHWTAFLDVNPYQFNAVEKYYIRKIGKAASRICPVSEDLKNAIQRFGIEGPFEVVPNVVDTEIFQFNPDKDFSKVRILHVSTLNDAHKNISGLLRTIQKLSQQRKDFEVELVGNNFGAEPIKLAKRLGILDTFVKIEDEMPIEVIAKKMGLAHIFVLFSNYENLPCVISEAHASGLVVVATDVGGVREMLSSENGFLIAAKAEDELLNALNAAIDKIGEFDGAEIRAEAVERYGYARVGGRFLEIYEEVLK